MIVYILIVLGISIWYFDLLGKYTRLWKNISKQSRLPSKEVKSISIAIPFRNEENCLPGLIQSLQVMQTDGLEVEVLFVDDHSTDKSVELISRASFEWNVRVLTLEDAYGKKEALQLAWREAKGEIIVQTDADCTMTEIWLQTIVAEFQNPNVVLVSAPVQYHLPQNFWQRTVSLDFNALIVIGAAHIAWDAPMICNGANMAYRKELTNGAALHMQKASGDDVFLLQNAHNQAGGEIVFVKNREAMVTTNAPSSFQEFWNQRLRWASKNGEYDIAKNRYILIALWFFNVLILVSFLSFSKVGVLAGVFMILVKVLAEDRFYTSFVDLFKIKLWFKTILLGQPFHICYMAIVPPVSQFVKYKWKERKLR